MSRKDQIYDFLNRSGWNGAEVKPLAGDASFRRYDRVALDEKLAVLMDAPPEFEDTRPFVAVAEYLIKAGLRAPKIFASDFENGLLLIEDLGDDIFKKVLETEPGRETQLYKKAIDELIRLNNQTVTTSLPYLGGDYSLKHYGLKLMLDEVCLFSDWYYPALTGKRLSIQKRNEFIELWENVISKLGPADECFVLRDYHAENLLDLGNGEIGVLDFQDAVIGHSAYDLVSLLQDARRDVDPLLEQKMIDYFAGALNRDNKKFREQYAIIGAQRDVKIIGIFARLYLRDGKDNYLKLMPRMWGLLERCLKHPALSDLKVWFDQEVPDKRDVALDACPLYPDRAMILAAGLGKRMRPLTDHTPKPLIKVREKELLSYTLDALAASGVKKAVINKHYLPEQIDGFIERRTDWRPDIELSDESNELMDSGGGVKKALHLLGNKPFFILNSDMIWTNGEFDALSRLATEWRDDMDILMLLIEREKAHGHDGAGDFHKDSEGRLHWRGDAEYADYLYGGIMIIRRECFEGTPDDPFSLKMIFDRTERKGRLFGLVHDGSWYHVGEPAAVKSTEMLLQGK